MTLLNKIIRGYLSNFFYNLSATNWLIIINCILFVIFYVIIAINSNFVDYIALKPENILQGKYLWTLVTSMFMHSGIAHLFVNMFSLMFIGNFLEKILGRKRFLWFYIIAGLFAGLFFSFFAFFFGVNDIGARIFGSPDTLAVGASGALFGLLGIMAVIVPRAKVYLILGPLIAIIIQSLLEYVIKDTVILGVIGFIVSLYFIVSIFAIISFSPRLRQIALPVEMYLWVLPFVAIIPLIMLSFFVSLPIGNMAHLGGLLAGLIYGIILKMKYKNKIKVLNKMYR